MVVDAAVPAGQPAAFAHRNTAAGVLRCFRTLWRCVDAEAVRSALRRRFPPPPAGPCSSTSAITTLAPSRANIRAVAAPMPDAAPENNGDFVGESHGCPPLV